MWTKFTKWFWTCIDDLNFSLSEDLTNPPDHFYMRTWEALVEVWDFDEPTGPPEMVALSFGAYTYQAAYDTAQVAVEVLHPDKHVITQYVQQHEKLECMHHDKEYGEYTDG